MTPRLAMLVARWAPAVCLLAGGSAWAQAVNTTTLLASSINPTYVYQSATLTATVSGSAPTGNVLFFDGGNQVGWGAVLGGHATFTTSFASAGTHALTAVYQGDATNRGSTSAVRNQTVKAQTNSSTALGSDVGTPSLGQRITLTATVTGTTPTGTVTFNDNSQPIGSAAVTTGRAILSIAFNTVGAHSLNAVFSGDVANTYSSSAPLTLTVIPGNMTQAFGYDPEGNLTRTTNPFGLEARNTYDLLQRLTRIDQPPAVPAGPAPTIGLAYNGRDQLTSVQDPRSLATSYASDGLANLNNVASPDSGSTIFTYDAAGNRVTSKDARNKTTTYTYDVLERVKTISYATGVGTVFEYDGGASPSPGSIGQLTKVTDEAGVTTFSYDTLSRPTTRVVVTNGKTLTTSYAWGTTGTAIGKVISITYPSKARVNYTYDSAGRIQTVKVNPPTSNGSATNTVVSLNLLSAVTYNADNQIKRWTWGNNAPYVRTYDSFGRLASFPVGYPQGTGLAAGLTRTLAYDNAGRITGYTHTSSAGAQAAFNQGFGYDGLDRLVQQTTTATNYGFAYDASGNRTSRTIGATTYTNTVAATSNRLTNVQTPGVGGVPVNNTQSYTASGSLTADGTATYTYSDRGRMATSIVGGVVTTYRYNGLEQRVSKTGTLVPTGAAYYAYDEAGRTLGEYDATLYPIAETVYLGSTPVAVLKLTGTAAGNNIVLSVGNVYADQIDTPRVVTRNSDEAILWRWDGTEAFGNSAPNENPSGLGVYKYNQRMPGQIYDAEDQNFYNWNREYQPRTGRYGQSDPIGIRGGINTFGYAGAAPTQGVDPTGEVFFIPILVGAASGALIDIGIQLLTNHGDTSCIDWTDVGVSAGLGAAGSGIATGTLRLYQRWRGATKGISNPVPQELARVIAGRGSFPTLGAPGRSDVFVTAAEDIAGLNAKDIARRLTISESDVFTIIRFPTPKSGLASPVSRLDPGFIGGGRTAGGAREFVVPNGPIPRGAKIGVVGP